MSRSPYDVCRRRRQTGDALLITLITLILMTLGLFAIMRVVKTDSQTTGALGWRAQASQAADRVLQETNALMQSKGQMSQFNDRSWFFNLDQASSLKPDAAYWANCANNTAGVDTQLATAQICDTQTRDGFTVKRVVRVLGSRSNAGCTGTTDFYHIFIHAENAGSGAQADVEQIYRVCSGTP